MTRLLAIETSGGVCGAAVAVDGALASTSEILRPNVHDELLTDCVASAVAHAGLQLADIDVVAVSAGPGSFTGLRIGASFAKGLCFDGSCSLLAVPTLTALHHAGREVAALAGRTSVTAVVASHRDLFYIATHAVSELGIEHPVRVIVRDELQGACGANTLVVGPAAAQCTSEPVSGLTRLSARFVAHAAWALLAAGVPFSDPQTFVPAYEQDFIPRS